MVISPLRYQPEFVKGERPYGISLNLILHLPAFNHEKICTFSARSCHFVVRLTFWVRGAVRRGLLNPMVMQCVCERAVAKSCASRVPSFAMLR